MTRAAGVPVRSAERDGEAPEAFASPLPQTCTAIFVNGTRLIADCAGVLYWPDQRTLIVADLHLEKGSSFARHGMLLPPYDTAETLTRLKAVIGRYDPALVIALGDNFHDDEGATRLSARDRVTLGLCQDGRRWIWVAGNHDPEPIVDVGGTCADVVALGDLVFRHEPTSGAADGEIAGHLHPSARMSRRGRAVVCRCFASDQRRLVMPAFGAYAGGLDIRHRAFMPVFGGRDFAVHLIGAKRLYGFSAAHCL